MLRRKCRDFVLTLAVAVAAALLALSPLSASAQSSALPEDFVKAMEKPEDGTVTLYSLDPGKQMDKTAYQEWNDGEPPRFHKFNVLGKVALNAKEVTATVEEINAVTRESLGAKVDGCFYPRHGVSIRTCDNSYDFVICYSCAKYAVYRNGTLVGYYAMSGPPDMMNELVKSHNIVVAK